VLLAALLELLVTVLDAAVVDEVADAPAVPEDSPEEAYMPVVEQATTMAADAAATRSARRYFMSGRCRSGYWRGTSPLQPPLSSFVSSRNG